MKPLTNWPRKGSVLPALNWPPRRDCGALSSWQTTVRYMAGLELNAPEQRSLEYDLELFYGANQDYVTWEYRNGFDNAGLREDVVQAIEWMAGTPQFTASGLQIVPMADEQLAELELWLEAHRQWRAEEIPYSTPVEFRHRFNPDIILG